MGTTTYDVPGISCGHCKAAIEGEVSTIPGVDAVDVDVDARTVTVTVTVDGEAADAAVRGAIVEAGYEVAGPAG